MSNSTISINEQAFSQSMEVALAAVGEALVEEVVKVTPRDLERLPIPISRKDGKAPRRKGGVVQIFGNYYRSVTGNLKRSITYGVNLREQNVTVGVSSQGSAIRYAAALEFGTPRMAPRSFIGKTVEDPEVQLRLFKVFEITFYNNLQKFNG